MSDRVAHGPRLPLALSAGDPAGVGPRVAAVAASALRAEMAVVLFGDASVLTGELVRAGCLPREIVAGRAGAVAPKPNEVGVCDTGPWPLEVVMAHAPTGEGGRAQLRALESAHDAVVAGLSRALVTGPVSKQAIVLGGTAFIGQTEHLARRRGLADDDVSMLFLGPRLAVGLVTTHLALASVPSAITAPRVVRTAVHLGEALIALDPGRRPRIAVAGLNPHAGEHGLFGDEESLVLGPAIERARLREPFASRRAELVGVVAAETAFRHAVTGALDGVVAMYHDQATIASKLVDFGDAVNVTWGLGHVRTSVDHGVAYDAAAAGEADHRGMLAALRLAHRLTAPAGN